MTDGKRSSQAQCAKCGDTGVIETGNNDLPCECRAGDVALFNTCEGVKTGAEVRATFNAPRTVSKDKEYAMTDEKRVSDEASESCHKCNRRFPDVSMINDGDDSLGPPVCCDCYDPNYKAPRPSEPWNACKHAARNEFGDEIWCQHCLAPRPNEAPPESHRMALHRLLGVIAEHNEATGSLVDDDSDPQDALDKVYEIASRALWPVTRTQEAMPTLEEADAELGDNAVKVADMGRAIAYLGKVARWRWPGGLQQSELEALLAEVREDERKHAPSLAFLGKLQCVLGFEGLPVTYDDLLHAVRALVSDKAKCDRCGKRDDLVVCSSCAEELHGIISDVSRAPCVDYPRIDQIVTAREALDRMKMAALGNDYINEHALRIDYNAVEDVLDAVEMALPAPRSDSATPKGGES